MTRIAVLGAGANGAAIGADLVRAGLDVTLIEQWPAHAEAMRRHGVRIELDGELTVTPARVLDLCQLAEERERFDIVLLVMKAYDTVWASRLIEPYLADDGLLVGVQNGMTQDAVAEVVGAHRTIGCVIEVLGMMWEPGIVERTSSVADSWFAIGSLDPSTEHRLEEVAGILRHAGEVEIVDDVRSVKWMKLVSNATTMATTSMMGVPAIDALALPGMRELVIRSGQEALDAGRAQGFAVLPIFGLTADDVADHDTVVESLYDILLSRFVTPRTRSTIFMDWQRGRRSEADDINGLVARVSREKGLEAPVNEAIVEVARRIEHGELTPSPANLELLTTLVS